jgi:NADPH:quinone reductase
MSDATTMQAVRVHTFGGPEVLQYEETSAPSAPQAGQAVVRVYAAGLNPVDTYIRSGTYVRKPALPYTPGTNLV